MARDADRRAHDIGAALALEGSDIAAGQQLAGGWIVHRVLQHRFLPKSSHKARLTVGGGSAAVNRRVMARGPAQSRDEDVQHKSI
jgi:hypothetical protein